MLIFHPSSESYGPPSLLLLWGSDAEEFGPEHTTCLFPICNLSPDLCGRQKWMMDPAHCVRACRDYFLFDEEGSESGREEEEEDADLQ
jgi:hypothetical protein